MGSTQAGVSSYPVCLETILDVSGEIPKTKRKVLRDAGELPRLEITSAQLHRGKATAHITDSSGQKTLCTSTHGGVYMVFHMALKCDRFKNINMVI